jgi:N-methylhydantoinase B
VIVTSAASEPLIRELSSEEFSARYSCDRFTATVLASRFGYIVEHMCSRLLTAAFSPILRDFYDFAATLTSPPERGYQTPAMSASILLFTGTMTDSVRNTVEEYGIERLQPGDVIVANDPYRNGTHVNDVLFTRPVFHEGRLACFVNMKAHQLDMGGMVPGGFSLAKRNVYENGLVLAPQALFRAGRPVHETWSLIFDNVRFGEILAPDMLTAVAELELGERMMLESIARYGLDAVLGAMTYVCDASAERMAVALAAVEDGEWVGEDLADCDAVDESEEYRVRVRIVKRGARAEVDFSGTSRQARSAINATALDAKTSVGVAFKSIFDPQGWFTSGTTRPIDIVMPEGTVISALPPDGAVFAYWEQSQVILSALLRALAQAVGEAAIAGDRGSANIHNANGLLADGRPWISAAQVGGEIGPFGANRHGDADSQMLSYQANGIGVAVEAIESDAPVVVLRHEIVPDSAGPGRFRGGAALLRDSLWLTAAQHHLMSLRFKRAPGFGANGGGAGATGGIWLWDEGERPPSLTQAGPGSYRSATAVGGVLDPETLAPAADGVFHYPHRVPFWETRPDTVLRYVNCGGGGWGDPLERDPELVKRDVRDGYVTIAGAASAYGVVVAGDPERDPEGLVLDLEATERLRTQLRAGE